MSRNKRLRVSETRTVEVDPVEDNGDDGVAAKPLFDRLPECTVKTGVHAFASEKEIEKFHKLSADAQDQCIKAVVRFFVMKGARREAINKVKIQEVLEKVDPDYKKLANAVLSKAAKELRDVFGYQLVTGNQLIGTNQGKKDDYFLLSTSGSKRLRTLLAQSDKSAAYFGFMNLVLFSVLMSPGEKASCASILSNVRKVDPRFPLHIPTGKNAHAMVALAIPELGDDFLGLLNRMKKEQYLGSTKDDVDTTDLSKVVYSFGPRFFAEIGRKQLALAYFTMLGQPVDQALIADIERDDRRGEEEEAEGGN